MESDSETLIPIDLDQALEELDRVPACYIDGPGLIFKYILIKVTRNGLNLSNGEPVSKNVIRGLMEHDYHIDILEMFVDELKNISDELNAECLGGGRIQHGHKQIKVYGYSQGFGQADHKVAVEILKETYPGYDITDSNEGY